MVIRGGCCPLGGTTFPSRLAASSQGQGGSEPQLPAGPSHLYLFPNSACRPRLALTRVIFAEVQAWEGLCMFGLFFFFFFKAYIQLSLNSPLGQVKNAICGSWLRRHAKSVWGFLCPAASVGVSWGQIYSLFSVL